MVKSPSLTGCFAYIAPKISQVVWIIDGKVWDKERFKFYATKSGNWKSDNINCEHVGKYA